VTRCARFARKSRVLPLVEQSKMQARRELMKVHPELETLQRRALNEAKAEAAITESRLIGTARRA